MPEVNRSPFASAARGGGGPRKSPLRLAANLGARGFRRALAGPVFLRAPGSFALTSPPRSGGR
jgi:hypothetical protein